MAKYKQNKSDRMDESLGMRRGPERDYKQSYKDRRDESKGMKRAMDKGRDSSQRIDKCSKHTFGINTMSEKFDMNRVRVIPKESRGYSSEAWDYKY